MLYYASAHRVPAAIVNARCNAVQVCCVQCVIQLNPRIDQLTFVYDHVQLKLVKYRLRRDGSAQNVRNAEVKAKCASYHAMLTTRIRTLQTPKETTS